MKGKETNYCQVLAHQTRNYRTTGDRVQVWNIGSDTCKVCHSVATQLYLDKADRTILSRSKVMRLCYL